MKVLIIIPTYNEKDNIERLISKIFALAIPNLNILIVDDNSPDSTAQIVQKIIATNQQSSIQLLQRSGKLGLGNAYITGFKLALQQNADLIFEMDADFSHDPKYLPDFIKQANDGFDVVLGSRRIPGGQIVGWNTWRKFSSAGAMFFARMILGLKTKDVTTGYRCFNRQALTQIDLDKINSNGYAFQEEMIYWCEQKKLKIKEIPITFTDRKYGQSKLSSKDIVEFFKTIIKLKYAKHNFPIKNR